MNFALKIKQSDSVFSNKELFIPWQPCQRNWPGQGSAYKSNNKKEEKKGN